MNLYGQFQKFAQQGVHSIDLDRLLQDNFDYNHLMDILPETFFTEMSHIKLEWNLKGSVCVDFGHQGVIYGYAHPQDVRFHKQRNQLPVKIGMTEQLEPVRKRIWDQQLSEYPQLLFMVTVPNASFVEDAVHRLFSRYERSYALGKEWFDVSPSEVIEKVLWMSALSCMNSLNKGELIELSGDLNKPVLNLSERRRRLQEVRNCLLNIDQNFQFQGTNFRLGETEGRGLKPNRLTPLSSGQYFIKHRYSDYCGATNFSQNPLQP
jgi:hypothetical protein